MRWYMRPSWALGTAGPNHGDSYHGGFQSRLLICGCRLLTAWCPIPCTKSKTSSRTVWVSSVAYGWSSSSGWYSRYVPHIAFMAGMR